MNKTSLLKKYCAVLSTALAVIILPPMTAQAADTSSTSTTTTSADQHHRHERLRRALLKKFDTNHNGKLDPNEVDALKKWIEQHRAKNGQ